jgi:glucose-1-phosphate cytidylyltransferase
MHTLNGNAPASLPLASMKTVILAGGLGTRLSEETGVKPKPMVEIGSQPILWHIMKIYSAYGVKDFIICCGYKGHLIKQYFAMYYLHASSLTFDVSNQNMTIHKNGCEPWRVTLVDTGDGTMTGGRLKRVRDYLDDRTFFFTYGDGVSDIDLPALLRFHRAQQRIATLTAVQPPGRFGAFNLAEGQTSISRFREKPGGDGAWINGGFFVLEPEAIDYIDGDESSWEREPMTRLAQEDQLAAYRHTGFWHPMDTLNDKKVLEEMWQRGEAPWCLWKQTTLV